MNFFFNRILFRKSIGVCFLFIEMILLGGTIFGFPALFEIFSKEKIYKNLCEENDCSKQMKEYQNAMTIGIAFFDLPAFFIGILIDRFGCRFVKLFSIIFHLIGWLALALLIPGRDYLLYIHCVFSSLSGIGILMTTYTSANYFSQNRAFISSLYAGAGISATITFSIFQIFIDNEKLNLRDLSLIWLSFGFLILFTSFFFLDWKYSFYHLPYQFDLREELTIENEKTLIEYFLSPLYLLVVLFLSILLIPTVFLSVFWNSFITHLTKGNLSEVKKLTLAYHISTISSIFLCPINGYILRFRSDQSLKKKLFNVSIVQTISCLFNIILCLLSIFSSSKIIFPLLIFNCLSRSTIIAGCQSVISTFFPSTYIGRLTGMMWTIVGIFTFIQFALIKLTIDIDKAWRAWIIILSLILIISIHLIQIWLKYFKEKKKESNELNFIENRF